MAERLQRWRSRLRATRERLGVSRAELARRSGVPADTLRRWEDGTRNPRHASLRAVLDALDCPSAEANALLAEAGFPPARTLFPGDRFPNYYYTAGELQDAVEQAPWPEFVINDNIEVVAANATVQALWGIDFAHEQSWRTSAQMNALIFASDHHFADRLVNWEEVVATLVSTFKGRPRDPHTIDEPDTYFDAVLAEFVRGDPAFLSRLIDIFAKTPAREAKCRWSYRVVWSDDEFGDMRFLGLVSTASEPDALAFQDWHPVDAATWDVLERVKTRPRDRRPALERSEGSGSELVRLRRRPRRGLCIRRVGAGGWPPCLP
jgi:transcriptional regulator with XRE-family HTH domain